MFSYTKETMRCIPFLPCFYPKNLFESCSSFISIAEYYFTWWLYHHLFTPRWPPVAHCLPNTWLVLTNRTSQTPAGGAPHSAPSSGVRGMWSPGLPKCPGPPHGPATLAEWVPVSSAWPVPGGSLWRLHLCNKAAAIQFRSPEPIKGGRGRGVWPPRAPNIPRRSHHSY